MYTLGIDIGTTFTAAAVIRGGHPEIVELGSKSAQIPSVVLLRADETVLTGEAALRRGVTEPQRMAREFKRRFGQPEPLLLGGTPYSPEALTAKLLRAVVEAVAQREGGPPARICLTHPANWGPFKRDLMRQVVRLSGVNAPVRFITEPEAAAVSYAQEQRVDPGAAVAVYDLGGGTFDATVLRKRPDGFEIAGQPEGIEQLGGIDVDAAVFHHVTEAIGEKFTELDEDDPAAVAAVARLRQECVDAKEALSSDTDATIPVLLPDLSTEVRLTRAELEKMVRPMLAGTIDALRRALESAKVPAAEVSSVLLVGGASRMPLVAQLVGAELGRPVAVDADPKHAVALGAAWIAERAGTQPHRRPPPPAPPRRPPVPVVPSVPPQERTGPQPVAPERTGEFQQVATGTQPRLPLVSEDPSLRRPSPSEPEPPPAPVPAPSGARRRSPWLAAAGLVAVLAIAVGTWFTGYRLNWWAAANEGPGAGQETSTSQNGPRTPAERLQSLVDQDRSVVTGDMWQKWVPQLSAKKRGLEADGIVYDDQAILDNHNKLRSKYDGVLVFSGDYRNSFQLHDYYVTLANKPFDTADQVLSWCISEGFAMDDCYAKRVSDAGSPAGNTRNRQLAGSGGQDSGSTHHGGSGDTTDDGDTTDTTSVPPDDETDGEGGEGDPPPPPPTLTPTIESGE